MKPNFLPQFLVSEIQLVLKAGTSSARSSRVHGTGLGPRLLILCPGILSKRQKESTMRIVASLAATVALALAMPALAQTTTTPKSGTTKMSQAECTAAWSKLDASKTGSVSQNQAQGVVTDFKAADANNDGKLTQAEFMAACDKGLVTASSGTGSAGRGMTGSEPTSPKK
jgi:hypothetical protein